MFLGTSWFAFILPVARFVLSIMGGQRPGGGAMRSFAFSLLFLAFAFGVCFGGVCSFGGKTVELSGRVERCNPPVAVLVLKDGRRCPLRLGPYWFWRMKGYALSPGEEVRVEAYTCDGILFPKVIHTQKGDIVLRDASGLPLWRGEGVEFLDAKGLRLLFAGGIALLVAVVLVGLWGLSDILDEHQRFEARRSLSIIEGRIEGFSDLLRVLPEAPPYLRSFAWLADELQGDPGVLGVRLEREKAVLLDTFGRPLPPRVLGCCFRGCEVNGVYYMCDVSGSGYFVLAGFSVDFKYALLKRALAVAAAVLLLSAGLFTAFWRRALSLERRLAASQRLAAAGRMAAMVAHEIRNPLNNVYLWFQCVAPGDHGDLKEGIMAELERVRELTDELLSLSRGVKVERGPVVVSELFERLRLKYSSLALRAGVEFEVAGDAGFALFADGKWLFRALDNLLRNAFEHTGSGGKVRLEVEKGASCLEFRVCNTGSSIPEKLREKIFEPFFTTRREGFGIGLFIVKQVAQAHGGTVGVEQRGEWLCFRMELPQKEA